MFKTLQEKDLPKKNANIEDASNLKRGSGTRKRHLIAHKKRPFHSIISSHGKYAGAAAAAAALLECSTLTSLVTSCRAYPLLSPVTSMHVQRQEAVSARSEGRRARGRGWQGGCKSRLVVLGQDAFPECVGVEHPFDALHSGVSEAGGVGRGWSR